jgi:hypothetical protein
MCPETPDSAERPRYGGQWEETLPAIWFNNISKDECYGVPTGYVGVHPGPGYIGKRGVIRWTTPNEANDVSMQIMFGGGDGRFEDGILSEDNSNWSISILI